VFLENEFVVSQYSTREAAGALLSPLEVYLPAGQYIQEHCKRLRTSISRTKSSDVASSSLAVHVAAQAHPVAGLATAALAMGSHAHSKNKQ